MWPRHSSGPATELVDIDEMELDCSCDAVLIRYREKSQAGGQKPHFVGLSTLTASTYGHEMCAVTEKEWHHTHILKTVMPGQTQDMLKGLQLSSTLECLKVHRTAGGSGSGEAALAFPAKIAMPAS